MRGFIAWLDERMGVARLAAQLRKVFPSHWSFLLGEVALYSFIVLVATGVFLTFFFVPSAEEVVYDGAYAPFRGLEMSAAYASALELSFEVQAGLVMRQIHHWSALVFVAAIVIHMARIFFTGAFRKPREINWVVGMTMLLLAIGNGFFGYSLLDDLLSGTGLRIGWSLALSVPIVGPVIAFALFGGEFPNEEWLPRFYSLHILVIPAILAVLLVVHLALVWRQKHTHFPGPGHTEHNVVGTRLWPTYAAKSVGFFFIVAGMEAALGGLIQINPIWLFGPFMPAAVSSPAQPDWYMGWLEGALRIFPPWAIEIGGFLLPEPFWPGVFLPGATFLVLMVWPWLEAWVTKDREPHHVLDRPSERPGRTAIGVTALVFFGLLFVAGSDDVIAIIFDIPIEWLVWSLRVAVLIVPLLAGWFTYSLLRGKQTVEAEAELESESEAEAVRTSSNLR